MCEEIDLGFMDERPDIIDMTTGVGEGITNEEEWI